MEIITYLGKYYPKFQSEGFAAKFAFPFALEVCKGHGVDVGCKKKEWALPGSIAVDPELGTGTAEGLAPNGFDYIFSSHMLEHVDHWVNVLDHWHNCLKSGGVLFLYLPDFSQEYWRPWNNRKHIHVFTPTIIGAYFKTQPDKWKNVFVSGVDLNNSFMVMAEKI